MTSECPACSETFGSETHMKIHHKLQHGESIAGVTQDCDYCGESFTRSPAKAERSRYCSIECSAKSQQNRVDVSCESCGNVFEVIESRVERYSRCPDCVGDGVAKKTCIECGDIFDTPKSRAEERKYCSNACQWSGHSVIEECENCGEEFRLKQSRAGGRFCSRKCYTESARENSPVLECEVCGSSFMCSPSEADSRRFCSRECYYEAQEAGLDPVWKNRYGEGWTEEKREKVRGRQGRRCHSCGKNQSSFCERLHVHHIIPADDIEDDLIANSTDNLVALCRRDHKRWEQAEGLCPPGENLPPATNPPLGALENGRHTPTLVPD